MAEPKPWDRLPGEKPEWYQRFLIYLRLGPDRSVDAVWQHLGGRGPAPTSWHQAAQSYNWEERAKAYDEAGQPDAQEDPLLPSINELAIRALRIIDREITRLESLPELKDSDVARLSRLVRALRYLGAISTIAHGEEEIVVKFD